MAYFPVAIWFASALISNYIARRRRVKPAFFWNLVIILLGSFAIPLGSKGHRHIGDNPDKVDGWNV